MTRMRKLGALMIVVFLVVELAIGMPAETKQHKVLVKEYQVAIDDSARCRLLLSLGNEAEVQMPDSALKWYDKAYRLASAKKGDGEMYVAYAAVALHRASKVLNEHKRDHAGAVDKSKQSLTLLHQLMEATKNREILRNARQWEAACYQVIGSAYFKQEKFEQSASNYIEAAAVFSALGDKKGLSDSYLNVGIAYHNLGMFDKANDLYLKSLALYKGLGDNWGIAECYQNLGMILLFRCEYGKARGYFEKALSIARQTSNATGEALCYTNLAYISKNQGDNAAALESFGRALEISRKMGDKRMLSFCLINTGNVLRELGKNDKALVQYQEALNILQQTGDEIGVSACYNSIGTIIDEEGNNALAIEYFQKALKLCEKSDNKQGLATTFHNLGNVLREERQTDKALEYLFRALEIYEHIGDKQGLSYLNHSIGKAYMQKAESIKGASHIAEVFNKALDFEMKALGLYDELGDKTGKASVCEDISALYIARIDTERGTSEAKQATYLNEALGYGQTGYTLSKELGAIALQNYAADNLKKVFARLGKYKEAYEYAGIFIETKDSLFDKAKSKFLADAVKKYETELKQLQIDKLNREKELQDQAIVKNQILIFSILGGLVVIMVFTVFLYRSFLKKKKANVIIEQKNVALEAAFSEIERQKNEIERISENEKRMNHLKLEFFTNISHEFRTPLSLIKAPAEKLITCETDPSRRELLRTIANNAGKLNMFVDQILDFRKLDAGTLTLYPVSDDVVKFVRQRFYSFTSLLETKHINMLFGAFNDSYTMAFDPRLLATSLDNILSNAFKYTSSQGTVTCAVELVGTEHDTLQVSITNTGKPIADEYLDKIFEPFFQVPGTVYGTGIGLALTREMMRLHQGHVTAKNIENAVCFSLLIPLEINVTQSSIDSSGQHQAVGDIMSSLIENTTTSHGEHEIEYKADHRKKTSKILIVEDNVELNHFLHEQLIDDYKVVCAFDGQTGIQMAKDKMPDLVISDVMMPVMNGLELCKELKTNELTSHLPVILLTAMTTEANVVNGFDTGADDYITKPFNLNELKARVANIIEQRQRLREKFSRNLISTEVSELATNKTDVQFLEKVMHVIESNIEDSSFGVPELASALAMSRQTLHDKMKKLSNESPGAFIQSARLKLAAKMLVSKAGNVTEIALATGFNDPTYFIRAFKKRFGVTPGEYKA